MMNHAVINGTSAPRHSEILACHEIPTDALLPYLSVILDQSAMKDRLQKQMFESAQERERFLIQGCEIDRVRYKPESSCMVTYRLKIEDKATGETGEQVLCGRAYPKGLSPSQWEKGRMRPLVQPRFGQPLLYLPDLELVLWSFPNDRKMTTLPTAIEPARFTSVILPTLLASHLGQGWQILGTGSQVVHYVGEHTCTVKMSVDLSHPLKNGLQTIILFGKTYYNEEGAETDRVMRQLWDSEARRSGRLALAKPLGYDTQARTLWQLAVPGITLETCDIDRPEFLSFLREAAGAVGALHQTSVSGARSVTSADLISNLKSVASILIRYRPTCSPALLPLVNRLIAQADMILAHQSATLHGDLHLKNFLVDDARVTLIDLDNVCTGSPYLDLGSLIAGLHTYRILHEDSEETVPQLAEAFLQTYETHVSWPVHRDLVNWHTAVALITERAYRCVTRLKEGRPAMIEELIALAGRLSQAAASRAQGTEL
ncbi:MAG: aminoglycoside phosphotransferase family protein [Nitrospira sp. CG24C]|nr:MAG: aminoglycoside phosphotransferase family protein [Nitrospira sp. CG24C]TKB55913.1 MAG: aminoglycoside phosphotransferase family protein [Nitrospira sp.]